MSGQCVGFVSTKCKDVLFILERVVGALDRLIMPLMLAENIQHQHEDSGIRFQKCTVELHPKAAKAVVHFRYDGEVRAMHVYFKCDMEEAPIGPQNLMLRMGCRDNSVQLVKAALVALTVLGDVYLDLDDTDEFPPEKLNVGIHSYLALVVRQQVTLTQEKLQEWYALWCRGSMRDKRFWELFSIAESDVIEICAMKSGREASDEIEKLAKTWLTYNRLID